MYCVLTRRNAIGILMGIELILNSANINYLAFAFYGGGKYDGQIFAIFVIMLAAAEAVIGLAVVLAIYQNFRTIDVECDRDPQRIAPPRVRGRFAAQLRAADRFSFCRIGFLLISAAMLVRGCRDGGDGACAVDSVLPARERGSSLMDHPLSDNDLCAGLFCCR